MNEVANKQFLDFIAVELRNAHGIYPVKHGFWLPDYIREHPDHESYWADGFDFTFYMIFAELPCEGYKFIKDFLNQQVYQITINHQQAQHILVTFGGGMCHFSPASLEDEELEITTEKLTTFKRLPTKVTIPEWFDSFIFNDLEGRYAPDFRRYATNLNLTEDEVLNYSGTYCLRSVGEAKLITSNLLMNQTINRAWLGTEPLKILDIGSGSGGNLAGIIMAIKDSFVDAPELEILSVDGNKNMLTFQQKIMDKVKVDYSNTIHYTQLEYQINSIFDLQDLSDKAGVGWNYITTFKCLSEIPIIPRIYYEFTRCFSPLLADNGLLLVLDVTTKDNLSEFNPILLNQEISGFEQQNPFRTLLPLSCAIHSNHCQQRCFTQQQFLISHSRKAFDKSKVAYRILGREQFIDSILSILPQARYIVKWNYTNPQEATPEGICPHCNNHEENNDAYLLN